MYEFGFRRQCGIREVILRLGQVIEKQNIKDKPTFIVFVDNVEWKTLFWILTSFDLI